MRPDRRFPAAMVSLALLWHGGALGAEDKPKADQPQSAAGKEYQVLVKEFQKAVQDFHKAYSEAKDPKEKGKLLANSPTKAYAGRFIELAKNHPKDPAAFEALSWVIDHHRSGPVGRQALDLLKQDHARDEKIGPVCQRLAYTWELGVDELLRAVLDKNPHRDAQGLACLTLGWHLKSESGIMRRLKQFPDRAKNMKYMTPAYLKGLQDGDPDQTAKQAELFCERVIAKYADVPCPRYGTSAGNKARAILFEMRHLVVGKTAPDIEGEDIDGQKFKLSDYRGKVVLLDFWGNW